MKLTAQAEAVWLKGRPMPDKDEHGRPRWPPDVWRRDAFDNAIRHDDYGNRDSDYGWEIDHIVPVSRGGTDAISNLRPLQWSANVARN